MKLLLSSPEALEARIAPAAAVLDLGKVDGSNGFHISGEQADDQLGSSLSKLGDFNGDGIDDFILGAPDTSPNGVRSGGAYVVFGTRAGIPASLDLGALDGTNGFKIIGEAAGDSAGTSVSSAGDVNGDRLADLIIGAPNAAVDGRAGIGAAYIVYGARVSPATLALSSLDGAGVKIEGGAPGAAFAAAVSGAGDFNGDGFADVVVGAPQAGGSSPGLGAAHIIFGGTSLPSNIGVSGLAFPRGFTISGEAAVGHFGYSLAAADINGDGIADLVVGAPGADSREVDTGAVYVIYGRRSPTAPTTLSSLNGTNGFKLTGAILGEGAGVSVAAGDVTGDGLADIVVGAANAGRNGEYSGSVYVVFGKRTAFTTPLDLSTVAGSVGFRIDGEQAGDLAGSSVSTGDVTGDGVADLMVGSPGASPRGGYTGTTVAVLGNSTFPDTVNLSDLDRTTGFKLQGGAEGDESGASVRAAGDINGDGFGDLLIGAPGADGSGEDSGVVYVIYGHDPRVQMSSDGQTFKFTESDGDVVTLKISAGGLLPQDIVLAEDGSIESVDLTGFANPGTAQAFGAKALNFLVSVKTPAGSAGNGFTKIGLINAEGVSMGKVNVPGDLAQIFAGGSGPTGLKSLIVGGNFGSNGGAAKLSKITGAMKTLKILGNLQNDSFEITGNVKLISIQKDLLGGGALNPAQLATVASEGLESFVAQGNALPSGLLLAQTVSKMKVGGSAKSASISVAKGLGAFSMLGDFDSSSLYSDGGIKAIKVAGKMSSSDPNAPSTMTARNKLGALTVSGDVENARILVGYDKDEQPVNADARVGRVLVKGNWVASSLVAGIDDSTGDGFGRNDTVISSDSTPSLLSRIANIVIQGTATGSAANGDHFGISAQQIGKLSIAGVTVELNAEGAVDLLLDETNNDFRLVEIG